LFCGSTVAVAAGLQLCLSSHAICCAAQESTARKLKLSVETQPQGTAQHDSSTSTFTMFATIT
jgi:hypothetical protein